MAQYGGLKLTKAGRLLLAKALVGAQLNFSRVMSGDGFLPDGAEIYDLTDLVSPKKELPINSMTMTVTGAGTAVVRAIMTNQGQAEGFWIREIGLFADDPDEGEILYAYANAGDKADYLPGQDGADIVQNQLSLIAVVDQAANVTATIKDGLVYVTQEELEYRLDEIFAVSAPILEFWTRTQGDGNLLRPSSLDDVKLAILGITDIESLNKRVERLEDVVAQILLELEVQSIYPDYTHWICEDFRNPDQVDLYTCKVLSVVAGDDSLDCDPVAGMYPGSWYTITDGIAFEHVQVKSVSIENGIQRVILTSPVEHTYRLENCYLYRTSAKIGEDGSVLGPTGKGTASWNPSTVWQGQTADEEVLISLDTTVGNSSLFVLSGDVAFTADGAVTLEGSADEI